jgi:hypothetical protein
MPYNNHPPNPLDIPNKPDRHSFAILGERTLFLAHLPMFVMENHCYEVIVEAVLRGDVKERYLEQRRQHPEDTFFLGNAPDDLWTMPELQIGRRRSFMADIWRGIPYKTRYEHWPWMHQTPAISGARVDVERVVHYRHLDFNEEYRPTLSYVLFGAETEAFLVHRPIKKPHFDHVVTLAASPAWLPPDQLRAGVPVNIPRIPDHLHCKSPLQDGLEYEVRYAGFPATPERLTVRVGRTEWFCTKFLNFDNPCREDEDSCKAAGPFSFEDIPHPKEEDVPVEHH